MTSSSKSDPDDVVAVILDVPSSSQPNPYRIINI
ncbi:unnamed protein product [Rhodiola kirilowii]